MDSNELGSPNCADIIVSQCSRIGALHFVLLLLYTAFHRSYTLQDASSSIPPNCHNPLKLLLLLPRLLVLEDAAASSPPFAFILGRCKCSIIQFTRLRVFSRSIAFNPFPLDIKLLLRHVGLSGYISDHRPLSCFCLPCIFLSFGTVHHIAHHKAHVTRCMSHVTHPHHTAPGAALCAFARLRVVFNKFLFMQLS